jgi:hypothetical protein
MSFEFWWSKAILKGEIGVAARSKLIVAFEGDLAKVSKVHCRRVRERIVGRHHRN